MVKTMYKGTATDIYESLNSLKKLGDIGKHSGLPSRCRKKRNFKVCSDPGSSKRETYMFPDFRWRWVFTETKMLRLT
jgi:hypothetical protein